MPELQCPTCPWFRYVALGLKAELYAEWEIRGLAKSLHGRRRALLCEPVAQMVLGGVISTG